MPLSTAISRSLFEAMTFHLVSRKISLFFRWEAQSFNLLKSQKLLSVTFSRFQYDSKYHLETHNGLIIYYAVSFLAYCRPNWKVSVD